MLQYLKHDDGFTLIELIVVIAVFSILSVVVMPRIINYLSSSRDSFLLLTTTIEKAFDDAFVNQRTNFIVIHCYDKDNDINEVAGSIFDRTNGISIVIFDNNKFIDNPNRLLKFKEFSDSFIIKEVLLPDGTIYTNGNIFIPCYPSGYSAGAILHILVNGQEEWSIVITPYIRTPKVIKGYIQYEDIK